MWYITDGQGENKEIPDKVYLTFDPATMNKNEEPVPVERLEKAFELTGLPTSKDGRKEFEKDLDFLRKTRISISYAVKTLVVGVFGVAISFITIKLKEFLGV